MPILLIAGDMLDRAFQEARIIAQDVASLNSSLQVEIRSMVEADWVAYLNLKKRKLRGRALQHAENEPLVIHSVLGYLGGLDDLVSWAGEDGYEDPRKMEQYQSLAGEFTRTARGDFDDYIRNSPNQFCFFDFTMGTDESLRVTFELFSDKCPKTCENFLALCTGEMKSSSKGTTLHYLDNPIHRIVKDAWIQGGDIVNGRGDASESVWGETFPDESFAVKHDGPGILAMANNGPHTNGSQWYITLRELPCFDGKRVAFGRVIHGRKTLLALNAAGTVNQRPKVPITICNCGAVVPMAKKADERRPLTSNKKPTKKCTVVVIGLDNAGKTTIVNHFKDRASDETTPTMGFDPETVNFNDHKVTFFGLGGAANIRGYWSNYFDEVHGIIYVIDAADADRMEEACTAFKEVQSNAKAQGKPVLIFLNKQDLKNPLSAAELALKLELDTESGLASVLPSTALVANSSDGPSKDLMDGLAGLLRQVDANMDQLEARIKVDMAESKKLDKEKKAEMKAKHGK